MNRANRLLCVLLAALVAAPLVAAETGTSRARALAAEGRTSEALAAVERLLSTKPDDPEGLFLRAVLLVELKRPAEAKRGFENLIERHPEMPEPYNNLAVIQAASGDYDRAIETLKRSLATHASYRTAYDNLTKIYTQLASAAYSRALNEESGGPPEVVELVLLGALEGPQGTRLAAATPPSRERDRAGSPTPSAPVRERQTAVPRQPVTEAPARPEPEPEPAPATPEMPAETPPAGPEAAESEPATPPAPEPVTPPAPEPVTPPAPEPVTPPAPAAPAAGQVASFVESWAKAWSEQRVDDYLGSYSGGFRPPDGSTLEQWRALRRERVSRPDFINVTYAFLGAPQVVGETASVKFIQKYESNTFSDTVTKVLDLVWENGTWKILEERVEQ